MSVTFYLKIVSKKLRLFEEKTLFLWLFANSLRRWNNKVVSVCKDADKSDDLRMVFYALGLLISVPFLTLTIVAYSITPRLRDIHGKALCHYCGCLAIAFTSLAIVQLTSSYICDEICISIGNKISVQIFWIPFTLRYHFTRS